MNIFIAILRYLVEILGMVTLVAILGYGSSAFINYIKRLIKKQTRIKFLCSHEYVLDWEWPTYTDSIVYRLDAGSAENLKRFVLIIKGMVKANEQINISNKHTEHLRRMSMLCTYHREKVLCCKRNTSWKK